jgi:hypothetical protein
MGGGQYSQDVARQARSTRANHWDYAQGPRAKRSAKKVPKGVHPKLDGKGRTRECVNTTPIVVALDVTRSRGDDTKLVYEKLPTFIGQIEMHGYVQGAAISFCAVGDANSDKAPVQFGQFEADNRLDEMLTHVWIEEGGGGTGEESYELAAWYYATQTKLDCLEQGRKGYFFFVGDECFYPELSKAQVKKWLGRDIHENLPSKEVFRLLQERFHVFFILPRQGADERRRNVDAEIQQRVKAAGGRYEGVDVRASLMWNNTNDLDLHVVAPSGERIFFNHKRSKCGGWLDVDMNVGGETTKPVENVQWAKDTAPEGDYRVVVRNYTFHEPKHEPTSFIVELEVNGDVQHFEGVISPNGETGPKSDMEAFAFRFDATVSEERQAVYDKYSEASVRACWEDVLPREHVLVIDDSAAILDVMLGALALMEGVADLDSYMADLGARMSSGARRDEALRALGALGGRAAGGTATGLPTGRPGRPGGSKRLR